MGIDVTDNQRRDFKVQQKLISARPVYEIFDEQTGEKIAMAKQTWLSILRSTLYIEDIQGNKIMTAKGGFFDFTFRILDEQGQQVAKLQRPWIAFRQNFRIFYRDDTIKAQGGYLAWGFEATNEAGVFAFRLDKKILAVRDQFRVSVGNYMDPLHAIASALVVDRVFFKGKGCGLRCIICLIFPILLVLIILASLL